MSKKKKRGGQPGKHRWIDLEEFTKVWIRSKTRGEVAKHFKISPLSASLRAIYLRKRGVPLKKLYSRMGRPRVDYTKLARMAGK